jgi:crotonobetainyl-CoA:carnitine CoA-transferase CaiB-like acyl-CoA transferase
VVCCESPYRRRAAVVTDQIDPPLHGIRVLEVGSFFAGPFCSAILGDLGAEITKIENPDGGDLIRGTGPFVAGESSIFIRLNRNKRSVALDLRDEQGKAAFRRLVERTDVLVENLRPGAMERLGLGEAVLESINPGLVYAAVSGWGSEGPYAQWPGLDIIAQAMSGIMSVTGEPGQPPVKAGVPLCDLTAGLYAAVGVLAALRARDRDGTGDVVDVSLFESGVSLTQWEAAEYMVSGALPLPHGSAHQNFAPYQAVSAADGYFVVGAASPRTWEAFCSVLGQPELMDDPRFSDNSSRHANRQILIDHIEQTTRLRPMSYWLTEFRAVAVPCGAIQRYDEVVNDPHLAARGFFRDLPHPTAGTVKVFGSPIHFARAHTRFERAGPLLGEHTREVLLEIGMTPDEVNKLTGNT